MLNRMLYIEKRVLTGDYTTLVPAFARSILRTASRSKPDGAIRSCKELLDITWLRTFAYDRIDLVNRFAKDIIAYLPKVKGAWHSRSKLRAEMLIHSLTESTTESVKQYLDKYQQYDDSDWSVAFANRCGLTVYACGHWHSEGDHLYTRSENYGWASRQLCTDCLGDRAQYVTDYNGRLMLVSESRRITLHNGDEIVTHIRDDLYVYSAEFGCWHQLGRSPVPNIIANYHSSKAKGFKVIPSSWLKSNKRAFGCELEVEMADGGGERALAAWRIHKAINDTKVGDYAFFENDGSVPGGFEIITQPAGLDIHREKFQQLLSIDEVKKLRSHNGGRCGFHIHVGREYLTKTQIYRAQAFINDVNNRALIKNVARRYQEGYCKIKNELGALSATGKEFSRDRYEAINVTGDKTIEFRIFRGSLKYESLMAALEFTNALLAFCAPGTVSNQEFNSLGFRKFLVNPVIADDTKYLRSYLAARGLATTVDNRQEI